MVTPRLLLPAPSYAGYCPQLKYNMGQTYGQLTYKLLTSPEVRRSSRLVLSSGRPQTGPDRTAERPDRTPDRPEQPADRPERTSDRLERTVYGPDWSTGGPLLGTTRLHRGEDRNLDNMIPGYTGDLRRGFVFTVTRRYLQHSVRYEYITR